MPEKVDYLIAGQGLAGSLLAWFMLEAGKTVLVVDPDNTDTPSRVAAGLMHPITGRRVVKSWMADTFLPFARKTYLDIEDKCAARFFEDFPVLELFHDAGQRNDWMGRSADEGFHPYISDLCEPDQMPAGIHSKHGGIWCINGGWVDCERFLDTMRDHLQQRNALLKGVIQPDSVEFLQDRVIWNGIGASGLIDCTGSSALSNPILSSLPFNPCKGETLGIRAEGLPKDRIIHSAVKLIPLGGFDYMVGATYDFRQVDSIATEPGRKELENALEKFIDVRYTVTRHRAAVRPSTRDRRPILCRHPRMERLFVFNGLGSKGYMMAPWLARHFCLHLVYGEPLIKEVYGFE
jgi:glycine/D-amino acid oxidase-like deaminating enzyme